MVDHVDGAIPLGHIERCPGRGPLHGAGFHQALKTKLGGAERLLGGEGLIDGLEVVE